LMCDEQAPITSICYEVGYNNLSNFNRQFLAEKGMTPSRFRRLLLDNINTAKAVKGGGAKHIRKRRWHETAHRQRAEDPLHSELSLNGNARGDDPGSDVLVGSRSRRAQHIAS
jgi:hypothetical protein